ncbi:type IV pilin protein [Nitratifractor sp.]
MIKKRVRYKKAFSLIELIFVIVVLGIVASIGSQVIAKVYESYVLQRGMYRATMKTELVLEQIGNRLRYAIPGTVGARADNNNSWEEISTVTAPNDKVLQWVAYDGDSFEAIPQNGRTPGWSGFCDLNKSSKTKLSSPGSKFSLTNTIIKNLSDKTKDINSSVVYFMDVYDGATGLPQYYDVRRSDDTHLTFDNSNDKNASERYKLAWSSYALSVEGGDLYLYYNFSPYPGASLNDAKKSLLLKNVSNFRFKGGEGSIRVKICLEEPIAADANVTACKEKVIF